MAPLSCCIWYRACRVLWAYDGWNSVTYLAGEVKNAQRNIPIALISGTIAVIIIYVLANLAYMYVLPVSQIAQSKLVASDAISQFFGTNGAALIAVAVMISDVWNGECHHHDDGAGLFRDGKR